MSDEWTPGCTVSIIGAVVVFFILGIGGCCYVQPQYRVWEQQKQGEAELARAESNRKIATLEAEAKLQSSKALAQAEVERAKGVAEANRIIGQSLQGNEAYLHYLWIHNLAESKGDVIYVPTETNLPILEAGRRGKPKVDPPVEHPRP